MKSRNNAANLAIYVFMVIGLFILSATTNFAQEKGEKPNAKLVKQAKITMAQAREIAQKQATGSIEGEELEKEHGKLVYSFDIRNEKGTITEVQVDAKTGKVVSTEEETKAQEMKEKQEDAKKKKKN